MGEAKGIDRRAFCKGSAAAAAALGALSLVGCAENELNEETPELSQPGAAFVANEEGAEWFAVPCWHNCGGRCVNKVLLKDGIVLRQKTDDSHEDSYDWPQSRGCIRGRSVQQQVFGPDRVKYPIKRKNWSPDNPNGHLRGIDEWERITWDEALDIMASEITKSREKYGMESVMLLDMLGTEAFLNFPLIASGGYTCAYGTGSPGTFLYPLVGAYQMGLDMSNVNDRYDLKNSEYVILWGHNAAWCAFGNPSYYLKEAKKYGCKFIFVGPDYNVTAAFVNAEWVPCRPATDTALLLGIAHTMLKNDDNGSVIDWDFLHTYTVGFDAESMPEGAATDENFLDYVMGKHDGIEKTAEWASEISGASVELIEHLAEVLGRSHNVSINVNGAPARNKGAENLPQMFMTVAAMGGHLGRPGNACSDDQYYGAFNSGPKIATVAMSSISASSAYFGNPVQKLLPYQEMWDAILYGKYTDVGNMWAYAPHEPVEGTVDIHVLLSEHNNLLQTQESTMQGIEAFRKVDFVCAQGYWMNTTAKYADLVLPIATRWEVERECFYNTQTDKENAFAHRKALEPLYESKSDYFVASELSKRLGVNFEELVPLSEREIWFETLANGTFLNPDGTTVPLCTITQEDLDRYGIEGTPQEGVVALEKFLEDGVYRAPRSENDGYAYVAYKAFVDDPEGHPLNTASGKFEIYCQAKADFFNVPNANTPYRPVIHPLPTYLPQNEGYVDSFDDWENKVQGKYPFQCANLHYLRRAHSDMDNLPWLRESMQNPVFINSEDAAAKGIANGDVILIHNDLGSCIRPATVTPTVMPGVIMMPHGAAVEVDEATGIDKAGAENCLINGRNTTTWGLNAYNTTLVDYEKYTGDIELLPDYEWEPRVPVAE